MRVPLKKKKNQKNYRNNIVREKTGHGAFNINTHYNIQSTIRICINVFLLLRVFFFPSSRARRVFSFFFLYINNNNIRCVGIMNIIALFPGQFPPQVSSTEKDVHASHNTHYTRRPCDVLTYSFSTGFSRNDVITDRDYFLKIHRENNYYYSWWFFVEFYTSSGFK